jgi:hypothetical protein
VAGPSRVSPFHLSRLVTAAASADLPDDLRQRLRDALEMLLDTRESSPSRSP